MSLLGLRDLPVDNLEDESLGLQPYANALAIFAAQCQTPLTIGLQGDWGSGKTSLMNLIKQDLESNASQYKIIWFNTWQYSQFGLQDELPLSLISHFLEELDIETDKLNFMGRLKSGVRLFGRKAVSVGQTVGGVTGELTRFVGSAMANEADAANDPAKDIKALRDKAIEAAGTFAAQNKRIIVFLDDLDRLVPERAVELLEAFKIFLDLPGCVFFLACDYEVISQGLSAKFGINSQELKGRSFFDKIIQLPFQMPVTQYDVTRYVENLLKNTNIKYSGDVDLEHYVTLIESSIGFNPRNLKRAFNCLLLLNLVADSQGHFVQQSIASKREKQKIIFANVCLQRAYDSLYRYLAKHISAIDDAFFAKFDDIAAIQSDNELWQAIEDLTKINPDFSLHRLQAFINAFYQAIQLASDGDASSLSSGEIKNLQTLFNFSVLTANREIVEDNEPTELDYDLRKINRNVAATLAKELSMSQTEFLTDVVKTDQLKSGMPVFYHYQPQKSTDASVYVTNKNTQLSSLGSILNLKLHRDKDEDYFTLLLTPLPSYLPQTDEWRESLKALLPEFAYNYLICGYQQNDADKNYFTIMQGTFAVQSDAASRIEKLLPIAQEYFTALTQIGLRQLRK